MNSSELSHAATIRDSIAKACGKENDIQFLQNLGYLFLALKNPEDMVEVMINKYTSLKETDIVLKLSKLKN